MPLRNLVIIIFAGIISLACYHKLPDSRIAAIVAETMQIVSNEFYEPVDSRELFEGAMNGMVQRLDPYSSYIGPQDFRQFQESLDQEFGGIGIVVELNPATEQLTVMSPLVGTPAYKAGIVAGDVILEIDGVNTRGMQLKDAVTLMRGKPGTPVKLALSRSGQPQPLKFTIERAVIPIESVLGDTRHTDGSWDFHLQEDPRIGYIRLTTFGEHTAEELQETLAFKDRKVEALILDLRNNAGGLLTAAVETCDMLIDDNRFDGRIVTTRGRGGTMKGEFTASPKTAFDPRVPMVVLVNRYSASASEIVAACLQDHQRAIVVGQRTWGKGTVQNVITLEGGKSALKLTTATYWRPSNQNIHRSIDAGEDEEWGVRPDKGFEVVLSDEQLEKVLRNRRQRDYDSNGNGPRSPTVDQPQSTPEKNIDSSPKPSDSSIDTDPASDADPSDSDPSDSDSSDADASDSSEKADAEEFDDPQLRRAIDYLQQRLDKTASPVQKA